VALTLNLKHCKGPKNVVKEEFLQLAGRHYGGWALQLRRVILTRPKAKGIFELNDSEETTSYQIRRIVAYVTRFSPFKSI
jgi:hypothetical protein